MTEFPATFSLTLTVTLQGAACRLVLSLRRNAIVRADLPQAPLQVLTTRL